MRFPRTIRLDASDEQVFDHAAAPGEWAVSGGFVFADADPQLAGKQRQAFRHGFLGTTSFGWSTLVLVAEIDFLAYEAVVEALAQHLFTAYGAPDLGAARQAAREEAEFAAGLCTERLNTLIAVERQFSPSGIAERFRAIEPPRATDHAQIWEIVADRAERGDV
jgi:Family of unknown function (DUF6505)